MQEQVAEELLTAVLEGALSLDGLLTDYFLAIFMIDSTVRSALAARRR